MTNKQLRTSARANAKNVLGKNYRATLPALLVMLATVTISSIFAIANLYIQNPLFSMWQGLISMLLSFAIIPIGYGFYLWAKKALTGAQTEPRDLFSVYYDSKLLIRIVKQTLLIFGLVLCVFILFFMVLAILFFLFFIIMAINGAFFDSNIIGMLETGDVFSGSMAPLVIIALIAIYIGFVVVLTYFSIRISAAQYLLVTYPNMRTTETLKRSFKMMKKHVWDYIALTLSVMWPVIIATVLYTIFISIITALSYLIGQGSVSVIQPLSTIVFTAITYCIMPYLYLTYSSYYNMLDYNYINKMAAQNQDIQSNIQNQNENSNATPEVETINGSQE